MSSVPAPQTIPPQEHAPPSRRGKARRRTAHLKLVPESRELRDQIRDKCVEALSTIDRTHPLTKDEFEQIARSVLDAMQMSEGYVGWTMVVLTSEFWREQVAAVPPSRRLLLLPHCLKHAEGCPADYDQFGLDCRQCGACSIADFRSEAEKMGYKVLVAEGSPIVLKIIVSGYIDAIVGVACLNVLEKAIDKILLAGIPCMATPLLSSDCRNTSVDEDWVAEMIRLESRQSVPPTSTYIHLMRAASGMFERDALSRLAPRLRGTQDLAKLNGEALSQLDPIASTEAIGYDFLTRGGKHSRPFITLAVYDALTGGKGVGAEGAQHLAELPDAVLRTAMSIETFHKASLVHDDIEDDDDYRYGESTLHRKYGIPTAINVGDYLIGLGYRLVSRETNSLGADVAADILNRLAEAHMKLSEGQGAELVWRDARDKRLTPLDALKIYTLKTAPAFEAALYSGARLAGDASDYVEPLKQFARQMGVAFQILNDLKDWQEDDDNKRSAAGDVLGGRPTILLALALEGLDDEAKARLESLLVPGDRAPADRIAQVRSLYQQADVFSKASRLIDKGRDRAERIADSIEPEPLRRLLHYLIDTVLEQPVEQAPQVVQPTIPSA